MKEQKFSAASALATPVRSDRGAGGHMPDRSRQATGPASRIDANVPAGIHNDSLSQAMAPFMGGTQLPTGQMINISMNAPSPHLSFGEWVKRGILGALGNLLAWPLRFASSILHDMASAIIGILKWALIVILIPTMIMIGMKMSSQMQSAPSIEAGASQMMHNGRHALNGLGKGATDELPAEGVAKPTGKGGHAKAD